MKTTPEHDARMANLTFASVYPHYITKVESKGRTKKELLEVIHWLTGFNEEELDSFVKQEIKFKSFFEKATLNPNAHLIAGSVCGYKIQEIENPLTKQIRYLDKLVDELGRGKKMEKILR